MPIKSIKKLPLRARKMWETVFANAKRKHGEERAAQIAWKIIKDKFKTERKGKKSIVVPQSTHVEGDNYVDVLLGFPTIDTQNEYLKPSFWKNRPMGVLKGDMEHYYADKAEGLYISDSDDYEGWVPVAQRFWHDGDNLMARVELPQSHPFTPTFLERWEAGEYGISIEYAAPEDAIKFEWVNGNLVESISEGQITGFTFTEDPAIDTKPKKD